jgi:rhodanese-related sulfurtransferase
MLGRRSANAVRYNRQLADHHGLRYNGYMVATISAREAAEIISRHDVDVVDVRDEQEWASGHIEQARLVPLDQLRADPERALVRDSILFVCARGMRSLTAAKLAERLGFSKLYSLEGGTSSWAKAGLPLIAGI